MTQRVSTLLPSTMLTVKDKPQMNLESKAKQDMEEFLKENPPPPDTDSQEYYAWNRRRVERARAVIAAEMGRKIQQLGERGQ